jgi:hypothetical protein
MSPEQIPIAGTKEYRVKRIQEFYRLIQEEESRLPTAANDSQRFLMHKNMAELWEQARIAFVALTALRQGIPSEIWSIVTQAPWKQSVLRPTVPPPQSSSPVGLSPRDLPSPYDPTKGSGSSSSPLSSAGAGRPDPFDVLAHSRPAPAKRKIRFPFFRIRFKRRRA